MTTATAKFINGVLGTVYDNIQKLKNEKRINQ